MLNPASELPQHFVRHIGGILADEEHAHALGADQPDHLGDALQQGFWRIVEKQVSLIEEEHQPGQRLIPPFGQFLHELGEQPQQEGGVDAGIGVELGGVEQADDAPAGKVHLHQVLDPEGRLAEEFLATLFLQHQQSPLDGGHGLGRDVAVFAAQRLAVVGHPREHRPQVLEIEKQQALVVGDAEGHLEDTLLGFIQLQQVREEDRPHLGHGGTHRMAVLAVDIPEQNRVAFESVVGDTDALESLGDLRVLTARSSQPREIALDVSREYRHPEARETLRQQLQGNRLACSGGAGDEAVAIGHTGIEENLLGGGIAAHEEEFSFGHDGARQLVDGDDGILATAGTTPKPPPRDLAASGALRHLVVARQAQVLHLAGEGITAPAKELCRLLLHSARMCQGRFDHHRLERR